MRKFEAAALLPDFSISFQQHVGPAVRLFEDACSAFARGTLIHTVNGPIAIEDLLPGDYVESSAGTQPVTWIGSTTYVPGVVSEGTTLTGLTRITSDAFGSGRPETDVVVGPAARMLVHRPKLKSIIGQDRILVPVSDYADGDGIVQVTPAGGVQLYHLMLGRHGTIRVGGLDVETYHPGQALARVEGPSEWALFLSMFPGIEQPGDFGELTFSRSTREVIDGLCAM
ncbi:Hint domain-containing protein [Salipiger mucosus]|uniref:Iron-regulated protein frpC n=1 Tax=Salipiger mucosus DSM 16094 TaxID=1123237 RepID=S9RC09_9RHOB|nr:Hint domain-containing protein [Salipiger mucosus]EPX75625.1 iron-regulated protein frpC [Salipiger mucosus DSM 16094]